MKKYLALLIFLLSSLTIIGISFLDGKIWDIILIVFGIIAYGIVGMLFSIGIIRDKADGKEAYIIVMIILIFGGYWVYKGIQKFHLWILSWPPLWKIMTIIIISVLCIGTFIFLVKSWKNNNNNNNRKLIKMWNLSKEDYDFDAILTRILFM